MITPPGSTIGIVGGGQLGRMLARAASRMGYKTHIYTPEKDSPASHVATKTTIGAYRETTALRDFAQSVDVITFEFENIPAETLEMLDTITAVRPKPSVLFTTRHRLREKEFIRTQGIATAPFASVRTAEELAAAIAAIGVPSVLKTCEMGYDGKGQVVIKNAADTEKAWISLGRTECILEGFVDFSAEASIIVARSALGEARCYPLVENIHRNHILHRTIAPASFINMHQVEATRISKTLAEALDVVGLLAVELFVTKDGLLVNELAPRPHNSGHWTIEGAPTAQFEQHIRAICGWALGDTTAHRPCEMINLLGDEWKQWEEYAKNPEAHVHLYGKTESRAGRKMGHVTIIKRS
jgi:5-(carboxyamino)imidazole ribonucleotide synthase